MARPLELTTAASLARWEDTYESLAYTAFALGTQADDADIRPLLRRIQGVLADWERVESDRRSARAAALAAKAHIAVADAALDLSLQRLAQTLLRIDPEGRRGETYARFFPEPHEAVIELGLDGELPAASLVLALVVDGEGVPDEVGAHADALRTAVAVGHGALAERAETFANLGRLQARVEAWFQTAEATVRFIHKALLRIGESRGLSYRWTASFFVDGTPIA